MFGENNSHDVERTWSWDPKGVIEWNSTSFSGKESFWRLSGWWGIDFSVFLKSISRLNELKPQGTMFQLNRREKIPLSEQAKLELAALEDSAFP